MAGEWQVTALGKGPLEIIDGDRGVNYPGQTEFRESGYCLFLNAGNVTATGFRFSDCAFITAEKDALLRKGKLIPNDVVLTTRGTVGNAAYFNDSVPFDHIRINSGMVILRAQPEALLPRYLYLFVRSAFFHEQVSALRTGSAQPQLPITDINRIEIPLPPLPEQRAIAHILGTLDDKIELNRRMNATLEAMARALFQSWFVDFDPVRAKMEGLDAGLPADIAALFPDRLVESEVGEIPEGWEVGTVGDLGEVICGKTPPTADQENYGEGTPFVTIPDMHGRTFVTETAKSLTAKGVATQPTKTLPPYSICVSCIATVGLVALTSQVCQTNQQINSVVPRDSLSALYCYFALQTLSSEIRRRGSGGSVVLNLNKSQFEALPVLVPSHEVSASFERWARPAFERILSNERESRTLAALRSALLPKLLSGEVRVKRAEQITEAVS